MPTAPKQFGAKKRKRIDSRKTASQRGYGSKWAAYSRQYRRENPQCAKCENETDCVDHIIPVTGPEDPTFWDASNHQPLCNTCHGVKTGSEENGMQIGRDNY